MHTHGENINKLPFQLRNENEQVAFNNKLHPPSIISFIPHLTYLNLIESVLLQDKSFGKNQSRML